jgi:YQGE family putative transporter
MKPSRRLIGMLVGVVMIAVVILPLFWEINYATLLMLGIGTSLFIPLYMIPMTSRVFDLIGATRESASRREEFIVLREAGLTAGRLLGLSAYLIVLPITDSPRAITWLLAGVGIVPIAGWWLMKPFLQDQRDAKYNQASDGRG